MPNVLLWGRSDPDYSRNRILRGLFTDLGWETEYFHPLVSRAGLIEAFFRRLKRPDLLWVPCFRHRDIGSAAFWAKKWRVPLVIDPLISAYEKEVFERKKWPPKSKNAEKKRLFEAGLFSKADVVVADTAAHADYFNRTLCLQPEKLSLLYVGAESDMFRSALHRDIQAPFEILFYGSFLQLQGVDVIVEAAKKTSDLPARWVLLGEGVLKPENEKNAAGMTNVAFEPWIPYDRLPERIAKAHILLGIFGTTLKADLVIPNKMFQAMASARPVITRIASAYPVPVKRSDVIGWIPAGDPDALANVVRKWLKTPEDLAMRGRQTRALFETFFSVNELKEQLTAVLRKALSKKNPEPG